MEPEIVPPVAELLLPDVEARRQPHLLGRVIGVELRLLFGREAKELQSHRHHLQHQLDRHSMVHYLHTHMYSKEQLKHAAVGLSQVAEARHVPERSRRCCRRRRLALRSATSPVSRDRWWGRRRRGGLHLGKAFATPDGRRSPAGSRGGLLWREAGLPWTKHDGEHRRDMRTVWDLEIGRARTDGRSSQPFSSTDSRMIKTRAMWSIMWLMSGLMDVRGDIIPAGSQG